MNELAHLQIRISSLEADVAEDRLDKLAKTGGRAERATDGITGSFKRMVGPAAAVAASIGALTKVTNVTKQFEVLDAQLVTATGSAENASKAFEAVQDFASSTPYDLQQVTEGFTKLVNLGLTPSERALTSYGDTASAMGKDLNQLIEAVADAATGEFERLKEFGIKTRSQGDQVSFTFRGVTTTVGKNAKEIEDFLIGLGETNFAGAMTNQMDSLVGASSNLVDEWNKLFLNISNRGIGAAIEKSFRLGISALEDLNAVLDPENGGTTAYIDALTSKFDGFGEDFAHTLDVMRTLWLDFVDSGATDGIQGSFDKAVSFIKSAFSDLPENIRAIIAILGVEFASLIDYGKATGRAFAEVLGSEIAKLVEKSKVYGRALGEALNPFSDSSFSLEEELAALDKISADFAKKAFDRSREEVQISRDARLSSIRSILSERDAALASFDDQVEAARSLSDEYRELKRLRSAETGDRLAQFKVGGEGEQKGGSARKAQLDKDIDELRLSLRTEEEAIQESYDRRLALILANTESASLEQNELKKRLDASFAEEALSGFDRSNSYDDEIASINESFERRRTLILENTQITEEARTALELELTQARNDQIEQLENARNSAIFRTASSTFDTLAEMAKGYAGEQSSLYKTMFASSKAFALADSGVKIQQGIANAASLPYPANLAAMGSVVTATASILSTIQELNYSGAYDNGGIIPAGSVGLVGEFGPELVAGPANVRSRRETAEMFKESKAKDFVAEAPAPQVNVKNITVLDPKIVGDYLATDEGEQVIMNVVQRNQSTLR